MPSGIWIRTAASQSSRCSHFRSVIFSAVNGVLIDTFPYAHFDRMVSFSINGPGRSWGREMLSVPEFLDFRDQNHVFLDMDSGNAGQPFLYRHDGQITEWTVNRASANTYIFFGVSLFRPLDHSRRHQSQCAAGFHDELQGLEGVELWTLIGIMPPPQSGRSLDLRHRHRPHARNRRAGLFLPCPPRNKG